MLKGLRRGRVTRSGGDNAWHRRVLRGFPGAPYMAEGGGPPRARLRGAEPKPWESVCVWELLRVTRDRVSF